MAEAFFHPRCFSQHVEKVITEEFEKRGLVSMKDAKACGVSRLTVATSATKDLEVFIDV